jgi:hypothetical protein
LKLRGKGQYEERVISSFGLEKESLRERVAMDNKAGKDLFKIPCLDGYSIRERVPLSRICGIFDGP